MDGRRPFYRRELRGSGCIAHGNAPWTRPPSLVSGIDTGLTRRHLGSGEFGQFPAFAGGRLCSRLARRLR